MGSSYPDPLAKSKFTGKIQTHWQNPDPLVKSRPTGKFQTQLAKSTPTGKIHTHWFGHKVVHIVTRTIKN